MKLKKDKIRLYSFIIFSIMIIFHGWQYVDSGRNIKPLIRLIFAGVYVISILLIGRRVIIPLFITYALTLAQFMTFQNYTPFIIIILAGILAPKKDKIFTGLYIVDAAILFIRTDTPAANIFIHLVNCFIFQFAIKTILHVRFSPEPLDLTPDEINILNELRDGRQQKEIKNYSQNTITKYLRNARERNRIATTDELLVRYIAEKII